MEMPPQLMSGITQTLLQHQHAIKAGIANEWSITSWFNDVDIIQSLLGEKYLELREQMFQKWGDFSTAGVARLGVKLEELTRLLQQHYGGWSKIQAEREINAWLYSSQSADSEAAPSKTAAEGPVTRPILF